MYTVHVSLCSLYSMSSLALVYCTCVHISLRQLCSLCISNKWNAIVSATKISQLPLVSVSMTILFNLNINNLLQREVNWRARYVVIWKQCRICTSVHSSSSTKRTENDDNILFPSNEHRRKIIHQTHIYLVFASCFRFTTDIAAMAMATTTTTTTAVTLYYI